MSPAGWMKLPSGDGGAEYCAPGLPRGAYDAPNRLTVVFDGDDYVAGGRAVDAATHPEVRQELDRLRGLGYLT